MTPSDKANRQFWAARREERPKPPVPLSVDDYIEEANRRLFADRAWVPGTRFIAIRPEPEGVEEPSWEGPASMRPLIQRIVQSMTTRYELPVPFRIDRL